MHDPKRPHPLIRFWRRLVSFLQEWFHSDGRSLAWPRILLVGFVGLVVIMLFFNRGRLQEWWLSGQWREWGSWPWIIIIAILAGAFAVGGFRLLRDRRLPSCAQWRERDGVLARIMAFFCQIWQTISRWFRDREGTILWPRLLLPVLGVVIVGGLIWWVTRPPSEPECEIGVNCNEPNEPEEPGEETSTAELEMVLNGAIDYTEDGRYFNVPVLLTSDLFLGSVEMVITPQFEEISTTRPPAPPLVTFTFWPETEPESRPIPFSQVHLTNGPDADQMSADLWLPVEYVGQEIKLEATVQQISDDLLLQLGTLPLVEIIRPGSAEDISYGENGRITIQVEGGIPPGTTANWEIAVLNPADNTPLDLVSPPVCQLDQCQLELGADSFCQVYEITLSIQLETGNADAKKQIIACNSSEQ